MKIVYTDTGREAIRRFQEKQISEIEQFIVSQKFVFGDETVEITANDVEEAAQQYRVSRTALKRTSQLRLISRTYLMFGLFLLFIGLFWDRIRDMLTSDPIALALLASGVVISFAGAYLATLWKMREDQEASAEQAHRLTVSGTEPQSVSSKECYHLLFQRLRKIAHWKHSIGKPICIDLLGVGLHNSHEWIEKDLKSFMEEFPSVYIELRIAFVAPETLSKFDFDTQPVDWAAESRERVKWVETKLVPYVKRSNGRLRVHVRLINNLPHWHGILVERRYLFLGRVSWTDGTDRFHHRPKRLTCADNGYRVFASDDNCKGEERVSLFRKWIAHYIYGNHDGTLLVNNISNFYDNSVAVIFPDGKTETRDIA